MEKVPYMEWSSHGYYLLCILSPINKNFAFLHFIMEFILQLCSDFWNRCILAVGVARNPKPSTETPID